MQYTPRGLPDCHLTCTCAWCGGSTHLSLSRHHTQMSLPSALKTQKGLQGHALRRAGRRSASQGDTGCHSCAQPTDCYAGCIAARDGPKNPRSVGRAAVLDLHDPERCSVSRLHTLCCNHSTASPHEQTASSLSCCPGCCTGCLGGFAGAAHAHTLSKSQRHHSKQAATATGSHRVPHHS